MKVNGTRNKHTVKNFNSSIESEEGNESLFEDLTPIDPFNYKDAIDLKDTISKLKSALKVAATSFISKFYSIPCLPRNIIQVIIVEINILLQSDSIAEFIAQIVSQLEDESLIKTISDLFQILTNPFQDLETEYKRKKFFLKNEQYIPPKSVLVGEKLSSLKEKGEQMYKNIGINVQYVPMAQVIKRYLESADNFLVIKSNLQELESAPVDFCQGSLWESIKSRNLGKFLIPIQAYHDDFNVGNVLGSHSTDSTIGIVYYTIGGFPVQYLSNLNNIFVSIVFQSEIKENFRYNDILEPLFDELLDLELNGINIEID